MIEYFDIEKKILKTKKISYNDFLILKDYFKDSSKLYSRFNKLLPKNNIYLTNSFCKIATKSILKQTTNYETKYRLLAQKSMQLIGVGNSWFFGVDYAPHVKIVSNIRDKNKSIKILVKL